MKEERAKINYRIHICGKAAVILLYKCGKVVKSSFKKLHYPYVWECNFYLPLLHFKHQFLLSDSIFSMHILYKEYFSGNFTAMR